VIAACQSSVERPSSSLRACAMIGLRSLIQAISFLWLTTLLIDILPPAVRAGSPLSLSPFSLDEADSMMRPSLVAGPA
jgi:cyanate permease